MFNRKRKVPVFLNVYDLSPNNQYMYSIGLGAYHSGVEVLGTEYTFGGHEVPDRTGVFSHSPQDAPGCQFREQILLGELQCAPSDISRVLDTLRPQFMGHDYNVVMKNCNHFSSAFSKALLGKDIPGWVNRLAWFGSCCSCCLPPGMRGPSSTPSGADPAETQSLIPQFEAFKGEGKSLLGSDTRRSDYEGETEQQRRERIRNARLAALEMSSLKNKS